MEISILILLKYYFLIDFYKLLKLILSDIDIYICMFIIIIIIEYVLVMFYFLIKSKQDIEFLVDIYQNVSGELEIKHGDTKLFSISWIMNPFKTLLDSFDIPSYPFNIICRLNGPDTIKAVSPIVDKLDVAEFAHPNKILILEWLNYIDKVVGFEMYRQNNSGFCFEPPEQNLHNIFELTLAVRLSKYATHAISLDSGFYSQ